MPTADEPDIIIEYSNDAFPPVDWIDITQYASMFKTKNAGVLKVPSIELLLYNQYARFTDKSSDYYIGDNKLFRVRADIGSGYSNLFYGRIFARDSEINEVISRAGFGSGFSSGFPKGVTGGHLTQFIGRDFANILVRETISSWVDKDLHKSSPEAYNTNGIDCATAVANMLADPDSHMDTGITLVTDTGLITKITAPSDPEKTYLLDYLRDVAELIGYDGYMYESGGNLYLYFKPDGMEETSPAIYLQEPLRSLKVGNTIEEVKNVIFVWGGTDFGWPPLDLWCEKGVAKFPYAWSGNNCLISDYAVPAPPVGDWNIQMFGTVSGAQFYGQFDISKSGYISPKTGLPYIDASVTSEGQRLTSIFMYIYCEDFEPAATGDDMAVHLIDSAGLDAHDHFHITPLWTWNTYTAALGPSGPWTIAPGFDWSKIEKIQIWNEETTLGVRITYVDAILFGAAGWDINPIRYPLHAPPVIDYDSINQYGGTTYHYSDPKISHFEQVQNIGKAVLEVNKLPIRKVNLNTLSAYPWAKPHQYLRLYLPEHNIAYMSKWKILEIGHEWESGGPLRTSFELLERPAAFDSIAIQLDDLSGIIKSLSDRI